MVRMVEQVEGAGARRAPALLPHGGPPAPAASNSSSYKSCNRRAYSGRFQGPSAISAIYQPHTAVDDRLSQSAASPPVPPTISSHRDNNKIRLHRKRTIFIRIVGVHLQIHRRKCSWVLSGADVDDLSAQPLHQRGVLAHQGLLTIIPVIGGKKHIDQAPLLAAKLLPGARGGPRYMPFGRISAFCGPAMMTLWERAFMPVVERSVRRTDGAPGS